MFLLTKEQQKLRAELREFVDHEVCPVATELDNRGGFPHDLYARIGKMGYLDAEFEYIGSGAKYGSFEGTIIIDRKPALSVHGADRLLRHGDAEKKGHRAGAPRRAALCLCHI